MQQNSTFLTMKAPQEDNRYDSSVDFIRSLYADIGVDTRAVQEYVRLFAESYRLIATPKLQRELDQIVWELDQCCLRNSNVDEEDQPER